MFKPLDGRLSKSNGFLVCLLIGSMLIVLPACNDKSSDREPADTISQAESEDTLPDDFPRSVPIYEPSDITTISTNTMGAGTKYVVGFMAEGTLQEVVDFYDEELKTNGWSIIFESGKGRYTASSGNMKIVVNVIEAGRAAVFTVTAPKQ